MKTSTFLGKRQRGSLAGEGKDSGDRSSGLHGETLRDERLKTSTNETQGLNTSRRKSSERASDISPVASPVAGPSPASEEDTRVYRDTTPSGIVVEYQSAPKRLYRVNGVEVPSVTTVLDALAKNGLSWWGMKVGVEGVLELFEREKLVTALDWLADRQRVVLAEDFHSVKPTDVDSVVSLLTAEKLTVNHALTKAGDRGTNVHSALEAWARSNGEFFPTPVDFPDEERPYVEALLSWIQTMEGKARPVLCEVMVGSAEYGFAGRYDLVLEILEPIEFIAKAYKRKEDKTIVVYPGRKTIDAKTSSGVYTSHFRQLAGYEIAAVESGYPATDEQFVLHLMSDGRYELVKSRATAEDFLAALRVWQSEQRLR